MKAFFSGPFRTLGFGSMQTSLFEKAAIFTLFLATQLHVVFADQTNVFVRFQMIEPTNSTYYVQLGGNLLGGGSAWFMNSGTWPSGAVTSASARVKAGEFTPWFDIHDLLPVGAQMYSRREKGWRSGGVAELPNVTADFISEPPAPTRKVVIELATAPDEQHIVKRFEESFTNSNTRFLVSPDLVKDAPYLETADQMSSRHLKWAREATGGKIHVPKKLMVVTGLSAQRPDLDLKEAEALHLLGFNTLSCCLNNSTLDAYGFDAMFVNCVEMRTGHSVGATREDYRQDVRSKKLNQWVSDFGKRLKGVSLSDEIGSFRFATGTNAPSAAVVANFHAWLERRNITPEFLEVKSMADVMPMDTPQGLASGAQLSHLSTRRLYYLSCRYRQEATSERVQWLTEAMHEQFGTNLWTHVMPADHPVFGGSGLGYRKTPDWGEWLSADWFDLARRGAVYSLGIEDWLGLQYMYGPSYTWEGFQLLSFMADIFRSGARSAGRDEMPMVVWIVAGDETNIRLKASSCLAHGVKNFYFWNYGPTCVSTENYWSDLRSEYDGIAAITRGLAQSEDLIVPGRLRPTRLAVLYSISSDIWQPFGYVPMLERRMTYFSLVHDQYFIDFLTEEDIEAGRLARYGALYAIDPCIATAATEKIAQWVRAGGCLYGSCGAGSRDEYNTPVPGLSEVFGITPQIEIMPIPGGYHGRGGLNTIQEVDRIRGKDDAGPGEFGVLGIKASITPLPSARVVGTYTNGAPAVVENRYGKGRARYFAACPAISYAKDAKFVREALKEKWPDTQRRMINQLARDAKIERPVELSSPVVEAGLYDSPQGLVLVLANYTYEPIKRLEVRVKHAEGVRAVESVEQGSIPFKLEKDGTVHFSMTLGLNDFVRLERKQK